MLLWPVKAQTLSLVCPHDCSFAVARVTDYVYIVTTVHTHCVMRGGGLWVGGGTRGEWVVVDQMSIL